MLNFFAHTQGGIENNAAYQKVMAMTEAVDDPDKQVGNFDPYSSPALPIGIVKEINGVKYIIAIDSAYFLNNGAYFSAYMAIDFPNSNKKIAFAAKNIQFNPKGVVGGDQAKLMLVSNHIIDIGPNTQLSLKGDGTNYVNWNCNGFESVNLNGAFLFSGGLLEPANADSVVSAAFEVNVVDINNLMAAVTFSPFRIRGLSDFDFAISQAYVDMSDYHNPSNVILPSCYQAVYPDDIMLWRGFYLKNFIVKLPEKLSENGGRKEIFARDMFIDDAGVTGFVGAKNVLNLVDGETDGKWGFSVDSLELGFTTNTLTRGSMDGDLQVPLMDNNTMHYEALISKNSERESADYYFSINATDKMDISCFNSTVILFPTTKLEMSLKDNKFKPQLDLNGKWSLDRENAKFKGIGFQNVILITEAPYITSGLFSLITEPGIKPVNEAAKFPISISHISLGILNEKPTIRTEMGLNFGKPDKPTNISVGGSFSVSAHVEKNLTTEKQEWKSDQFKINTIIIDVDVSKFKLEGYVDFKKDDPIYGDGFLGKVSFELEDIIDETTMYCMFGKMPTYKYWAIDVTAPVNIPLGGGVFINQLSGGLSNHVENTLTAEDFMERANSPPELSDTLIAPDYIPNEEVGIGFRAGVGYKMTPEKTLNGEVLLSVEFNSYGGLKDILFTGTAYMMTTKAERASASNYAKGLVAISYDNMDKILDARLDLTATFSGALTANIWSQIYISPDLWFAHLGTPPDPCNVSLYNFVTANAYFMFGQNLPPMPAPPPQVSGVIGGMSDGRNEESIAAGNGIGTGMSLHVGFNESIGFKKFSIYGMGYLGAGFDMTLYKYSSSAYCSQSGDGFGANYWFLNGQLYAYGGIDVGVAGSVAGQDFDLSFISASMAMLLQGSLPKPAYVYGGLNVSGSILGLISVNETFEFELGNKCTILD